MAAVNAMVVVLLPAVLYAVLHFSSIDTLLHFWSMLLLLFVPILWVCLLAEGLWWLGGSKKVQTTVRKVRWHIPLTFLSYAGLRERHSLNVPSKPCGNVPSKLAPL